MIQVLVVMMIENMLHMMMMVGFWVVSNDLWMVVVMVWLRMWVVGDDVVMRCVVESGTVMGIRRSMEVQTFRVDDIHSLMFMSVDKGSVVW